MLAEEVELKSSRKRMKRESKKIKEDGVRRRFKEEKKAEEEALAAKG